MCLTKLSEIEVKSQNLTAHLLHLPNNCVNNIHWSIELKCLLLSLNLFFHGIHFLKTSQHRCPLEKQHCPLDQCCYSKPGKCCFSVAEK